MAFVMEGLEAIASVLNNHMHVENIARPISYYGHGVLVYIFRGTYDGTTNNHRVYGKSIIAIMPPTNCQGLVITGRTFGRKCIHLSSSHDKSWAVTFINICTHASADASTTTGSHGSNVTTGDADFCGIIVGGITGICGAPTMHKTGAARADASSIFSAYGTDNASCNLDTATLIFKWATDTGCVFSAHSEDFSAVNKCAILFYANYTSPVNTSRV